MNETIERNTAEVEMDPFVFFGGYELMQERWKKILQEKLSALPFQSRLKLSHRLFPEQGENGILEHIIKGTVPITLEIFEKLSCPLNISPTESFWFRPDRMNEETRAYWEDQKREMGARVVAGASVPVDSGLDLEFYILLQALGEMGKRP